MNIGFFTDTYFPQVSGVATSIRTLKNELEKQGHHVYIFTTTDPNIIEDEPDIFRFPSVPFVSFTDRRIVFRGFWHACQLAKTLELDLVHTHTEFSVGWMGKYVAKYLKIPIVHTYHTMYEDYLHYIAHGKLLRPYHVKKMTRTFCAHMSGLIAPSERVVNKMVAYGVQVPMTVIPTGVDIAQYQVKVKKDIRGQLGLQRDDIVLLSLSRLAFEKNIDAVVAMMPAVLEKEPKAKLVIVGDGPARADLTQQVMKLGIERHVVFVGEVANEYVNGYYQMADLFVSASTSESQGLTYIEALAAGVRCIAKADVYTASLIDHPALGYLFEKDSDLAKIVLKALEDQEEWQDETELRMNKLYEISADCFGKRIAEFYKTSTIFYEKQLMIRS